MIKVGFIGAGNMGGALAKAAAKSGSVKMLITDTNIEKAAELSNSLSAECVCATEICNTAKYIFLGVKPQVLPTVLNDIADTLKNRHDRYVLVSMAAGVKCEKITDILGFSVPIIRIMPNMPVAVGKGMIVYTLNGVTDAEKNEFVSFMGNAGAFDEIEEELIDAASAVSGCGPAFAFMFMDCLAKGGEKSGLTYEKALMYAANTVLGSAKMLLETEFTPGQLIDAVCSPKGSTIEGVQSLQNDNFELIVKTAVDKSFKRTTELGK